MSLDSLLKKNEIIGWVGDFKTNEGYPYSKLNYVEREFKYKLGGGAFGDINIVSLTFDNGEEKLFAEKRGKKNKVDDLVFDPYKTIEIFKEIKSIGVKTYDEMFIGDGGKAIYSTFLNINNNVVVSANNLPPLKSNGNKYLNLLKANLIILNLDRFLKKLKDNLKTLTENNWWVPMDAWFYVLPGEEKEVQSAKIDFLIGDFDNLSKWEWENQTGLFEINLNRAIESLECFIDEFIGDKLAESYNRKILKWKEKILEEIELNKKTKN